MASFHCQSISSLHTISLHHYTSAPLHYYTTAHSITAPLPRHTVPLYYYTTAHSISAELHHYTTAQNVSLQDHNTAQYHCTLTLLHHCITAKHTTGHRTTVCTLRSQYLQYLTLTAYSYRHKFLGDISVV